MRKIIYFVCILSLTTCLSTSAGLQVGQPVLKDVSDGAQPAKPDPVAVTSPNNLPNTSAAAGVAQPQTPVTPIATSTQNTTDHNDTATNQTKTPTPDVSKPDIENKQDVKPIDNKLDGTPTDNKSATKQTDSKPAQVNNEPAKKATIPIAANTTVDKKDAAVPNDTKTDDGKNVKPTSDTTVVTPAKPTEDTKTTTEATKQNVVLQARGFDGPSFIGGIILTLGLLIIGFMGIKYYKSQTERNYHTL